MSEKFHTVFFQTNSLNKQLSCSFENAGFSKKVTENSSVDSQKEDINEVLRMYYFILLASKTCVKFEMTLLSLEISNKYHILADTVSLQ